MVGVCRTTREHASRLPAYGMVGCAMLVGILSGFALQCAQNAGARTLTHMCGPTDSSVEPCAARSLGTAGGKGVKRVRGAAACDSRLALHCRWEPHVDWDPWCGQKPWRCGRDYRRSLPRRRDRRERRPNWHAAHCRLSLHTRPRGWRVRRMPSKTHDGSFARTGVRSRRSELTPSPRRFPCKPCLCFIHAAT